MLRRTPEAAAARELLGEGFVKAWAPQRQEPPEEDTSRRARMARTMNNFVDTIGDAPVIVLALVQDDLVRGDITAGASVYPACHNLLLAARSLGYGGVITMWHRPVTQHLAGVLELPADVSIVATIPLGKPEGSHGPVRRRPLNELVYENRFGEAATWAIDPEGTRYTRG